MGVMSLEAVSLRVSGLAIISSPLSPVRQQQQLVLQRLQVPSVSLSSGVKNSHRPCFPVAKAAANAAAASSAASSSQLDMDLKSELGVNYEDLRDKLAGGEWEAADAETRRLLCVLAGEGAVKRKWVYSTEVQFIPSPDLHTIDGLWRAYSDNKFGYSVQRKIWKTCNGSWTTFFMKVSWTRPMADSRNNVYKKFPSEFMWDVEDPTPLGHLPLTNALRGTQLLDNLMNHPAFAFVDDEEETLTPYSDNGMNGFPSSPPPPPQQTESPAKPAKQPQRGVYSTDDLAIDYGF